MVQLSNSEMIVKISGDATEVVKSFLMVYLSSFRLAENQLDVTTALVMRYANYVEKGVMEPYASTILFSTDTRKELATELGISPAHLNNTFISLTKKNILASEGKRYMMNPNIIPTKSLTFKFNIVDG